MSIVDNVNPPSEQSESPSQTLVTTLPVSTLKRPRRAQLSQRIQRSNTLPRVTLRTLTYLIYDIIPPTHSHKDVIRVLKATTDLLVDEQYPPPPRLQMTLKRKCMEFLFAPAFSSLVWYFIKLREKHIKRSRILASALWTVLYRVAKQALIYRLFFRIGSKRYSLASALGIVCCFFKEDLFVDLFRLRKWPVHFSATQGVTAIARSLLYAAAFALPLQNVSKWLQSARRRANVKKILFALALSQARRIRIILRRLAALNAWKV